MEIFQINIPIDERKDVGYSAHLFEGNEDVIFKPSNSSRKRDIPAKYVKYFRDNHFDYVNSIYVGNGPNYEGMDEDEYPTHIIGCMFMKHMIDSNGRHGIKIMAVGENAFDKERVYAAIEKKLNEEFYHYVFWTACLGGFYGFLFICADKDDVPYLEKMMPSLHFSVPFRNFIHNPLDSDETGDLCHYWDVPTSWDTMFEHKDGLVTALKKGD